MCIRDSLSGPVRLPRVVPHRRGSSRLRRLDGHLRVEESIRSDAQRPEPAEDLQFSFRSDALLVRTGVAYGRHQVAKVFELSRAGERLRVLLSHHHRVLHGEPGGVHGGGEVASNALDKQPERPQGEWLL